jgi:hypothetical protein
LPVIGINRCRKTAAGSIAVRPLPSKRGISPSKGMGQEKSQQLLAFVDG